MPKKTRTFLPDTLKLDAQAHIPIHVLDKKGWKAWKKDASAADKAWAEAHGVDGASLKILSLPNAKGGIGQVLFTLGDDIPTDPWTFARLPAALAAGDYHIETPLDDAQMQAAALGWALAQYRFTRYRKAEEALKCLHLPAQVDTGHIARQINAVTLVRDLVNTPANDMGPSALEAEARHIAKTYGAKFEVTVGDDLLTQNYPAIHAVGRAASDAPRLIQMHWGQDDAPLIAIIGKGVCFDTGGLDIKPSSGMRLMKKDMGGAAHALALAQMIMDAGLPVRLRVLVPAVENAVAGNAFRPGDIIQTRKGLSVEIGNTDAEGRLVLCDAIARADEDKPDLILDFATLTGAARVALGPDLPALYSNNDSLAKEILDAGTTFHDPLWHMPLWQPYADWLKSPVADLNNISDGPFAGSITAALYLQKFVSHCQTWAHVDLFAWNPSDKPGRPKGGEAMSLRASFAVIKNRYGKISNIQKSGKRKF